MPASCSKRTASAAISGVCSAGFATTALPAASAAATWPGEDRERKIPRADADEHAAPAIAQLVGFAGRPRHRAAAPACARLRGVIAAISRPPRAHSATASSSVLPPSRLQQREQRIAVLLPADRRRVRARRRVLDRRRGPGGKALRRRVERLPIVASASTPADRAPSIGETPRARPSAHAVDQRRGIRRAGAISRAAHRGSRGRRIRRRRIRPLRLHRDRAAAGFADARAWPASAIQARGRFRIVAIGTSGSAATDTNDVLAPFSSSRRTR